MPGLGDGAVVGQLEVGGDADGGVVADLALELQVGATDRPATARGCGPR